MYWADEFADRIIKSESYKPYWVDDMKTPSGRIHVGSLRGVFAHDAIYKALLDRGVEAIFSYVFDDHDPMDALPVHLDQKKFKKHLGKPLNRVPPPKPGYSSYAEYFARDFIEVFNACGAKPKIIWASQLYTTGKMNEDIKTCLNHAEKIRNIYKDISGSKKPKDWYPFQVICPKCGKIGTTKVTGWDGRKVSFSCLPDLVEWAQGCGFEGKMSPYDGTGKLPWKIEWAVKWKVIGVTIEGAGKDHMSQGGSHDISSAICQKIINYPVPFAFSHEHFLVGGRKMSSSKGLGSSARDMYKLLPPELLRFLMLRPSYKTAINFDPAAMTIPDLFDSFDEAAAASWGNKDPKLARIYELSQVKPKPPRKYFLPRFRDIAAFIQYPEIDIEDKLEEIKGEKLTNQEKQVLNERIKYAKIWLDGYAPQEAVFSPTEEIPQKAKALSNQQKQYLSKVLGLLSRDWKKPEELQQELYIKAKEMKLPSNEAFRAIYLTLIGKNHGPRAAWLLLKYRKAAIKRLKEVTKNK
jgi:lysyl-tRNA synthetase class 1